MESAQRAPETLQLSTAALVLRVLGMPIRVLFRTPPSFDPQPKPFWDRFKIVRKAPVSLEDLLESRHLPPLELKTFEQYLCFQERAPENLYFLLWLKDYEKTYNEWEGKAAAEDPTGSGRLPSVALMRSFNDVKEYFFRSSARLELNITQDSRDEILNAMLPPHPSTFRRISDQVYDMLQDSLRRFLPWARQNIERRYVIAATIFGLFLVVVSFLPFVLGYLFDQSPLLRLVSLVPLLVGLIMLESARMSVCPFIYSLGDVEQMRPVVRQMRPYEATPTIPLSRQISLARTLSRHSSTSDKDNASTHAGSHTIRYPPPAAIVIPHPLQLTAGFIYDHDTSQAGTSTPPTTTAFKFDQLPNFMLRKPGSDQHQTTASPDSTFYGTSTTSFPDAPCFTKLVPVRSPIIHRMQWEVIIRSAVLSVIVAGAITGGLIAVPLRH